MGRPRVVKNVSRNFDISQGKLGELTRSDYASTYVRHKNYGMPRTGRVHMPSVGTGSKTVLMDLQTTNMKTYISHGPRARREMIRPQERGLDTDDTFAKDTVYMEEFQKKSPLPVVFSKSPDEDKAGQQKGKFHDKTTNKEFFKDYKKAHRAQRFGELPTFTHSLLFPDKENVTEFLCTRTQMDYPYKTARKPELIKGAGPNIKVGEGDHDHQTTQRDAFKFVAGFPKIHSKSAKEPEKRFFLPKMEVVTRYKSDYGERERFPMPRRPVAPAPDSLEIKMDSRNRVVTEQREQYHGWDVKKHKRPDPAKLPDNTEKSDAPMCTETTMQHDFDAKFTAAERTAPVAKPGGKYEPNLAKFHDMTTNKKFFQDWGTVKRLRHGDFHEACNEAKNFTKSFQYPAPEPLPKSTTHSVFVKKVGRPRTCMKPDYTTIDTSQENDFNTVTGIAYKYPPASAYIPEDFVVKC